MPLMPDEDTHTGWLPLCSLSPALQVGGRTSPALQVGGSSSNPVVQVGGRTSPTGERTRAGRRVATASPNPVIVRTEAMYVWPIDRYIKRTSAASCKYNLQMFHTGNIQMFPVELNLRLNSHPP